MNGSRAYVSQYAHELQDIVGVFNLDMFGYDADNDHCFEIHVGWTPASNLIGGCLADTVEAYDLGLNFEYIVKDAITASDHATFWNEGVGAIEILENFRTDEFENGCGERDVNPHYHTENDLIAYMNLETGHAIAKAAIAAAARMAEPNGLRYKAGAASPASLHPGKPDPSAAGIIPANADPNVKALLDEIAPISLDSMDWRAFRKMACFHQIW